MTVGELLHLLECRDRSMEVTVQALADGRFSLKPVLDGSVHHQLVGGNTFVLEIVPESEKTKALLIPKGNP